MMFDTLKIARKLESSGLEKKISEAIADVMKETIDQQVDISASKRDVNESSAFLLSHMKETETSIRADMKEMETRIRADMKEMETSIRADMKGMETSIRADMKEMGTSIRADLRIEMRDMKFDIIKWIIGLAIVQMSSFLGILKFIHVI
ncbi:MAG: DUF1640 domain-containing protein [Alphaproteobacteria bacterium]|nr:DUF1640 domain-containing protein [Alphaproteobacteria bacterium]